MCKRTMYKRARIPMFLWERRACANSGVQAVFPRPRKNGLGTTRLIGTPPSYDTYVKNPALRKTVRYVTFAGIPGSISCPVRIFSNFITLCRQRNELWTAVTGLAKSAH